MPRTVVAALLLLALCCTGALAQDKLTVSGPSGTRQFTEAELATRSSTVTIARDPVYRRAMTYRAVPLAPLLKDAGIGLDDYVQARATDNFSVAIPARLLLGGGALLALEDPAKPWPKVAKGTEQYSPGPFYIVWKDGPPVSSEYWAYRLAALAATDSPIKRWPQLAVAADVPAGDPVRLGLERFVETCLACHHFQGAGEGTQGPDLGRPMNPVDYFQPAALKKLLRDPDSMRSWPDRRMPAFPPELLSDNDIDAIVAWLTYKAKAR